ncbi:MAG TPA: TonB-dependent receptor [Candidatus Didemnitutus sp.]|nr:TonB-dependent receptor [Candidatus Didemnitutus sp.]
MNTQHSPSRRGLVARAYPLAILPLLAANLVFAQTSATDTGTASNSDQPVKLEKFEVTGSYIPAAADEATAVPVQIINQQAIALSGVNTNVLDVLRKTVPQIQGGNNIGLENGNISGNSTNGGSEAALRNIDTLVLINGKRVAASPVAAGGGYEFVDLNLIPLSAVDRIEVLTDGASAIYGSDAVSGVINIILKTDYRGAELDFHYTEAPNSTGGYWRERSASVVVGAGNAKTNVMFAAEWTKQDPLWERDVSYDNPSFGTATYPGVISQSGSYYTLNPSLNAPPAGPNSLADLVAAGVYVPTSIDDVVNGFNLSRKPTIMNSADKRIATASFSHIISDQITLKGDFLYAHTETNYQLNPQPVSVSTTTLNGEGNHTITDAGSAAAGNLVGGGSVTVANRFIGGPNRIYDNDTNFYRGTVELTGKVNDYFNWDIYANYNLSNQTALGENQILNSALVAGIANGDVNMFALTQDPASLAAANIFGTSIAIYKSQLYTYNGIANGKIWDLPGGALQYAAGLEYRKETLVATADYNSIIPPGATTSLWNNGVSLSPFDGGRSVKSEFGELKIPVFGPSQNITGLHSLTIDGAVRHESYSDGNHTTVPKVSLSYNPFNDEFRIRGTYAKSFSEPTLYDLYGPSNSGFTTQLGGLQAYNSSGQPTGSNFPPIQGFQLGGSNPSLTPSHAKSYTAGIVYSPKYAKGLEIMVDYYNIKQTDLIGSVAGTATIIQSVEQYGAASPFAPYVALGAFPGQGGTPVTSPGQLSPNPANVYVLQSLVNIGTQQQHGYDIDVKYTLPWQQYGRFIIDTKWAIMQSFFIKSGPTDPGTEYSGLDLYGTLPKARSYTTVDWNYQSYGATLAYTHINSVGDGYGDEINPYNTFDIQFRYDLSQLSPILRGVSFDVGCNNFTNQGPSLDRNNYASPPFDASTYSFFGRQYYMDVKIKF